MNRMNVRKALPSNQLLHTFQKMTLVQKISLGSICLLPLFHLTFDGWTGYWMVTASIFSLLSLFQKIGVLTIVFNDSRSKWMISVLIAYPVVIFLSQLLRSNFNHHDYLDTAPFLYFIPVFMFVTWQRIDLGKLLQFILPLAILGAYWSCFYHHRDLAINQWGNRLTPYFSDPLAFGQMILTLGLMSLLTIEFQMNNVKVFCLNLWSFLGGVVGIYLSIQSGSRTGWLAVPIVIFLFVVVRLKWSLWKSIVLGLIITSSLSLLLYESSTLIQQRVHLAITEISSYPWHGGVTPDTSVGLRITFQRLGWFYFSKSPFYGWGTGGYTAIKDASELTAFSTLFQRDFVYGALFHNELMTQMVRYGVLGITGYIFAVLVPLMISVKSIQSKNKTVSRAALLCSIFIICQIVSGFSDEFLNLKGMAAFYAFMISSLIGTIISFSKEDSPVSSHY